MMFDFAEAHVRYGGMGTMLVIKVGVLTSWFLYLLNLFYFAFGDVILSSLFFGLYLQVSAESANEFGELVADPITKELLHYTEKPETFVCI